MFLPPPRSNRGATANVSARRDCGSLGFGCPTFDRLFGRSNCSVTAPPISTRRTPKLGRTRWWRSRPTGATGKLEVRRGDIFSAALHGDTGKPRPVLIVQTDLVDTSSTVLVVPFTSEIVDAPLRRLTIQPSPDNGLLRPSQLMFERMTHVQRSKCRLRMGYMGDDAMDIVAARLAFLLGTIFQT